MDVALDKGEWENIPRACHRIHYDDDVAMQDDLLARKMANLVETKAVLQDGDGAPLTGGLFAVAKPPKVLADGTVKKRQRLIFDRRPHNATENDGSRFRQQAIFEQTFWDLGGFGESQGRISNKSTSPLAASRSGCIARP